MIKKPTVLILGAGASHPFGFPLGHDLYLEICNRLSQSSDRERLAALGKKSFENVVEFSRSLYYSGLRSIDSFLEHRPEFMEIGKLSICLSLIPREIDVNLFKLEDRRNNWYEYLFNSLRSPRLDEFCENKLSIVTFNYDRSIEHYLYTTIKNTYGISDEDELTKIMKKIPIFHVYGKLDPLPWQKPNGRPYSSTATNTQIIEASRNIRLLSDKSENSPIFRAVARELKKAERILLLGFGYDSINLKRLQLDSLIGQWIKGTCYRKGKAEIRSLKQKNNNIHFSNPRFDILKFFNDDEPL